MKSKPTRSGLLQGVLLVVGVLMANNILAVEMKKGSSQSPLSWVSVEGVETAIDRSAALDSARRAIGGLDEDAGPAWIEFAIFTDKYPFGEVFEDRPVWLVNFPAVRVDRGDNKTDPVEVEITGVIDPKDGRLLEAYTRVKDIWYHPQFLVHSICPPTPEARASQNGYSVSPCTVLRMPSTIAEVLGALGNYPKNAGQIIVRPRTVACKFPAVEVEGELVPIRKPGPFWLVHVMGTITFPGGTGPPGPPGVPDAKSPYKTGKLTLMDDDSLEVLQGSYLP